MDNNNVLPDTETPEEDLDLLSTPEAVEDTNATELLEKNKKLYARAKKAEDATKVLKEKLAAQTIAPVAPKGDEPADEIGAVLQLKSEGRTDAEILALRKYSKLMGKPIDEVMKDPIISAGLNAQSVQAQAEQATPSSSSRTFQVGNKSWEQMSSKERSVNYDAFLASKAGAGKNSNV